MKRIWNNFYLLMIGIMLIWAPTSSIATYLMIDGLTPGELVLGRSLFAFVALLAVALAFPESRAAFSRYQPRHLPAIIFCGLVGSFVYTACQYFSIATDLDYVVPYVIINYLWPLTTIVFAMFILKERRSGHIVAACLLGFLGFLVIQLAKLSETPAAGDGGGLLRVDVLGGLLAFGAAITWGLYSATARKASDVYDFEPRSSLVLFEAVGLVACLVVYGPAFRWATVFTNWKHVGLLLIVGSAASALATLFWLRAIKVGGAGRTAIVSYLTPVLALVFLGLFFGQWPKLYAIVGLALILAAVALAEFGRKRKPAA